MKQPSIEQTIYNLIDIAETQMTHILRVFNQTELRSEQDIFSVLNTTNEGLKLAIRMLKNVDLEEDCDCCY